MKKRERRASERDADGAWPLARIIKQRRRRNALIDRRAHADKPRLARIMISRDSSSSSSRWLARRWRRLSSPPRGLASIGERDGAVSIG